MAKKHKELDNERKDAKRKDEEVKQPEGKDGKRTPEKPSEPQRKGKSPRGRTRKEPESVRKTKPTLGYQGRCILNPEGAPRFGKS